MPMPTKKRQAVKMLNMPMVSPCQYEPLANAVKMMRMMVEIRSEFVRDQWSERKPKISCPTTVPAKAMAATFFAAVVPVYKEPYFLPNTVVTEPITWVEAHTCQKG